MHTNNEQVMVYMLYSILCISKIVGHGACTYTCTEYHNCIVHLLSPHIVIDSESCPTGLLAVQVY